MSNRAMAKLKTQQTDADVSSFLATIDHEERREDCLVVAKMMERITGLPPKMWGASIIGFGSYHYKYKSGREGEWFLTGLSPRKQALTLYIMPGFKESQSLLSKLGQYKTGKSCLYIKRLSDVDLGVLEELITASVAFMREKYE